MGFNRALKWLEAMKWPRRIVAVKVDDPRKLGEVV